MEAVGRRHRRRGRPCRCRADHLADADDRAARADHRRGPDGATERHRAGVGSAATTTAAPTTTVAPATTAAPTVPATPVGGAFIGIDHGTTGTAVLLQDATGAQFLRLQDLDTTNGPDLFVYLSTNPPDGTEGAFDDDYLNLGLLEGNVGSSNYPIPAGTDVARYASVVIWCDRFNSASAPPRCADRPGFHHPSNGTSCPGLFPRRSSPSLATMPSSSSVPVGSAASRACCSVR